MEQNLQKKISKRQESKAFNCKKCNDTGFIIFKDKNGYSIAKKCPCTIQSELIDKADKSGLGDLIKNRTLKNYIAEDEFQMEMKDIAEKYIVSFLKGERYSFTLLGQSGIGKTHIMSAVSRVLVSKNIQVRYYTADDIIQRLNACKFDTENYTKEFSKIANSPVLFVDELFKSSIQNFYNQETINAADFREIFKIINYRYNKKMPILLNSEIHFERFADLDQALIGRIYEMCKKSDKEKFIVSVKPDKNKNYRLKG